MLSLRWSLTLCAWRSNCGVKVLLFQFLLDTERVLHEMPILANALPSLRHSTCKLSKEKPGDMRVIMEGFVLPPWDSMRLNALIQLAGEHFGQILPSEARVLAHSVSAIDLPVSDTSKPRPQVRAAFLRWLATDPDTVMLIDPKGIRVWSATISDRLDLQGCRIPHQLAFLSCMCEEIVWIPTAEMNALYFLGGELRKGLIADGIGIHGPLFIKKNKALGAIKLVGARIGRNLDFSGTVIESEGIALALDGAQIEGSVFLHEGFTCRGEIRLLNTRIRGDFGCNGAQLFAKNRALSLDKIIVEGNMSLSAGFHSTGMVALPGSHVLGDLDCEGARLDSTDIALNLASARIDGHLYLRGGFHSSGELCMHSATIGKSIDLSGAVLTDAMHGIQLERATVGGDVFLCEDFQSNGNVMLPASHLKGNLTCDKVTLPALYCLNMKLDGDLIWTGVQNAQRTSLWLNGAEIGTIRDERESWPGPGLLHVDGLTYREITLHDARTNNDREKNSLGKDNELRVKDRIAWLNLQPFSDQTEPQPWMQLAGLLKEKGDNGGAKQAVFELRRKQARTNRLILRWFRLLLAQLERQPLCIAISILCLTCIGSVIFWHADRRGSIAPTDHEAYSHWRKKEPIESSYPRFNPFVYSLENDLPLVRLGQDDKWAPDPNSAPKSWMDSYTFLSDIRWFLILAGWGQATILASAIASRFKD